MNFQNWIVVSLISLMFLREILNFFRKRQFDNDKSEEAFLILREIKGDTQRIREHGHTLINTVGATSSATDYLITRLEQMGPLPPR